MKPIRIDLAPFSLQRVLYRTHPVARWFALAAFVLCVVAGIRAQKLLDRLDALHHEAARLSARVEQSARLSARAAGGPIDAKQAEAVNAAVARLNLPWDDILDALEAATPQQVALLSITPEPSRALLKVEAQVATSEAMIDYLKALEKQPLVGRVYLVKHEHVRDGADSVIRFQIEAQWRRTES